MAKHTVPQTDAEYEKNRRRARKAATRAARPGASEGNIEAPRRVSRREREASERLEVEE